MRLEEIVGKLFAEQWEENYPGVPTPPVGDKTLIFSRRLIRAVLDEVGEKLKSFKRDKEIHGNCPLCRNQSEGWRCGKNDILYLLDQNAEEILK